jgi:hypothetical protein
LTANTDRDCLELQAADLTLSSNGAFHYVQLIIHSVTHCPVVTAFAHCIQDSGGLFTSLFVPREPSSGESNSLEFDGPP